MTTRKLWLTAVMVALPAAAAAQGPLTPAPAQSGSQLSRPPISPYLNLLRPNNPAYLNYYGLVQPQLQATQNAAMLQQQVTGLQQQQQVLQSNLAGIGAGPGGDLVTGHYWGYFTHRGYFQTQGGGASFYMQTPGYASGGGGGGVAARPTTGVGNQPRPTSTQQPLTTSGKPVR